jgi:opacity protein-like surface antigen
MKELEMKIFAAAIGFALLAAGFAAAPAAAQQTSSERSDLARYERYAQAPVDHVKYFQINGFQYLAPDKVAVWFGVNKLYLLTVQMPCTNLAFANGIGLTAKNNTLYSRFDAVTFGNQRCKILKLQPVNELQMKRDANKAEPPAAEKG